ncbi:pilus assembly protein CpaF [Marinobacter halodurans]|uniref:Pilus assembly protein CpaF n=1 Tax=Marinobacter halodurans TaxID=2528979 RepID=A0ABY1ZL39_9GAMM|nr:AAA family ATPase [Marinobacter halodurans]TBW54339.1 pilus assembly protein CpaF [Marinobacter halodurans]
MKPSLRVLLSGRDPGQLEELEKVLVGATAHVVSLRHIGNANPDPLYNLPEAPEALIFCVTGAWEDELSALNEHPLEQRPPTIVVGPENIAVMRQAMRACARDYFSFPLPEYDLKLSLNRIANELHGDKATGHARLTAIINAKGGSGASTIASTLAHSLVARIDQRVALLDLDFQFGHLSSLFDLPPDGGLVDAITCSESMDAMALEGHMHKHKSGLHILGDTSQQLVVPGDIEEGQLKKLINLVRSSYQQVVVDLPRQIDPVTGCVLESADCILLVVQQSVAHVQDARQMIRYLNTYLGISHKQIKVVVNRWEKRQDLETNDIRKSLEIEDIICIPNDFTKVAESANLGIPLLDFAPSSPVSRSVTKLAETLSGKKADAGTFGFAKVLRKLART